jgi:hypothetical protein
LQANNFNLCVYSPHALLQEDPRLNNNLARGISNHYDISYYNRQRKRAWLLGDVPIEYNKKSLIPSAEQLDKLHNPNTRPRKFYRAGTHGMRNTGQRLYPMEARLH